MQMKTLGRYFIPIILALAVVMSVAWFYHGGVHFKLVSAVCYGYAIGWLSGFVRAKLDYQKKSG
jgi:uncharacterized membrane protein YfcA